MLLETLILDQLGNLLHGLYEVCAHVPVSPLKTLHLLHKCRLLAKIMPLWIRRKGENPIAEDRVRDLRGEDAKGNCRFHGSSRHAARDVDHSDHTRETNGFPSARRHGRVDCHIEGDAQHCGLCAKLRGRDKGLDVVHEHGRLGLLGFARLDHFEQAVPHGLPLNVENRADSVGELPPSLRIEHLLN